MAGCIEWPHAKDNYGYGAVFCSGTLRKVHRLAYWAYHGELPEVVRHTCDNPSCYNVHHLEGGTQLDNVADMVRKKRHAMGSRNGFSLLKEQDVLDIRRKRAAGKSVADLSTEYGVSKVTLYDMLSGKTWSWLK